MENKNGLYSLPYERTLRYLFEISIVAYKLSISVLGPGESKRSRKKRESACKTEGADVYGRPD